MYKRVFVHKEVCDKSFSTILLDLLMPNLSKNESIDLYDLDYYSNYMVRI